MEKVGLDGAGMRTSSGSETVKRTRLVEPSESGIKVISRSKGFRSAYERGSNSKKVSALIVCVAAIFIVSAVAVALGREAPTKAGIQAAPSASYIVTSAGNASTVTVDASGSSGGTGPLTYSWNWGDFVIGPVGVTSSHYYLAGNFYTIVLTVTDSIGQTGTASKVVQVKNGNPPPFPYTVYGGTFASDGVTPLPFCWVNITDERTGATLYGTQSDNTGAYSVDVSPLVEQTGDTLTVQATAPGKTGSNTGVVDTSVPYLGIDVTLTATAIPEFTTIVIPIVGMISVLAVASVVSSRRKAE